MKNIAIESPKLFDVFVNKCYPEKSAGSFVSDISDLAHQYGIKTESPCESLYDAFTASDWTEIKATPLSYLSTKDLQIFMAFIAGMYFAGDISKLDKALQAVINKKTQEPASKEEQQEAEQQKHQEEERQEDNKEEQDSIYYNTQDNKMHTVLMINIINRYFGPGKFALVEYLTDNFGEDYGNKNLFKTKDSAEKIFKGYFKCIGVSEEKFVEAVNEELEKRNWKFGTLKYKKFNITGK